MKQKSRLSWITGGWGSSSGSSAEALRGAARLTHVDDDLRISRWLSWLKGESIPTVTSERERRLASMLLLSIWGLRAVPDTFERAWTGLWESAPLRAELVEVLDLLREGIPRVPQSFGALGLPDVPLQLGATYARDEILAGFGALGPGKPAYAHQRGPWHDADSNTEILFITLKRSPKHYSPETLYRDYAISRELFHWETPNDTRVSSSRGRRYLEQRTNGLRVILAVREARTDAWGATAPYVLLGPCELVEHQGERSIAITWRLLQPVPADLLAMGSGSNWRSGGLDSCIATGYTDLVILSWKSRKLKRVYNGDRNAVGPDIRERVIDALLLLDNAADPNDVDLPGLRLHPLKGDRRGTWSITITGNWRITFRFKEGDVCDVDLEDYH